MNALLQAVSEQPIHVRDILFVADALHKQQACARQIGCNGQVNAADTIPAAKIGQIERFRAVYVLKGSC